MTNPTVEDDIEIWCMREWKVLELGGKGNFDCESWWERETIFQVFTLNSPEGQIPHKLIEELWCGECEDWCVDFSVHAPVGQDLYDHDECQEFFVAWGTHGEADLLDVIQEPGSLKIIFLTAGFPADHWAQEVATLYPSLETTFEYQGENWRGGFTSVAGQILNEVHESID